MKSPSDPFKRCRTVFVNRTLPPLPPGEEYAVELDLSAFLPRLKVRLAPEYDEDKRAELMEREWINLLRDEPEPSAYAGQIEMRPEENHCRNCKYKHKQEEN